MNARLIEMLEHGQRRRGGDRRPLDRQFRGKISLDQLNSTVGLGRVQRHVNRDAGGDPASSASKAQKPSVVSGAKVHDNGRRHGQLRKDGPGPDSEDEVVKP